MRVEKHDLEESKPLYIKQDKKPSPVDKDIDKCEDIYVYTP